MGRRLLTRALGHVDTVEHEGVEVWDRLERGPESLQEVDRARMGVGLGTTDVASGLGHANVVRR